MTIKGGKVINIIGLHVIIFCLITLCTYAHAAEMTKKDLLLESTWMALHFVDWRQTVHVAKHPQEFEEMNPILGRHPSVGRVNLYMAAGMVLHPLVSYVLPQPYKKWWQYVTIGLSGGCVVNNFTIGVKMSF